jgi:hypothetical protein
MMGFIEQKITAIDDEIITGERNRFLGNLLFLNQILVTKKSTNFTPNHNHAAETKIFKTKKLQQIYRK